MPFADRSLPFYRAATSAYALESIADHRAGELGWTLRSEAGELFYYWIAVSQPEAEVSTLMSEPDAVFLSELAVERDGLDTLSLPGMREWFAGSLERFAPRPVIAGDHSAWVRLVPTAEAAACG